MRKKVLSFLLATVFSLSGFGTPVYASDSIEINEGFANEDSIVIDDGTDYGDVVDVDVFEDYVEEDSQDVFVVGEDEDYGDYVIEIDDGETNYDDEVVIEIPESETEEAATEATSEAAEEAAEEASEEATSETTDEASEEASDAAALDASTDPAIIGIQYKIKFVGNGATGGSTPAMNKCVNGEPVKLNANGFKKKGNTFKEWNTQRDGTGKAFQNEEVVDNLGIKNGGTVSLYAQWTEDIYTISYELNGGTIKEANPEEYTVSTPTIKLNKPVKGGYIFGGWYKDEKFKSKANQIKKGSTGNLTLFAKWNEVKYTIKFNGNKSTGGKMTSLSKLVYTDIRTLPENKFTKKGYNFIGWKTVVDEKEVDFADKAEVKVQDLFTGNSKSITLTAQWEMATYTIEYNLEGGSISEKNPETYSIVTKTFKLNKPVKEGNVFAGWYTKDSKDKFKKKLTQIKKGSYGNLVLFAKWTPVLYTVKFNGNGSNSGKMTALTKLTFSDEITIPENEFIKKGCEFGGWNTSPDGLGISYESKAKVTVKDIIPPNEKSITLYAQWKGESYSITYHLDGGINNPENPEEYTQISQTITLLPATRQYYTFGGWYTESSFKNKVTQIKKGSTGDLELYAKWTPFKYTITFNGNNETGGTMEDLKKCESDETYTLPANNYVRTGYEFLGWNTKSDGSGKAFADQESVTNLAEENDQTIVMYAQWKVIEYTITYVLNGGTNDSSNPEKYTVESADITLGDATKAPYAFVGWFADDDYTEKIVKIRNGSTGNLTLYARWGKELKAESFGAKANDGADDSDAINEALEEAAWIAADEKVAVSVTIGSGTFDISICPGTYALKMRSNVSLDMSEDTVLKLGYSELEQDSGVIGLLSVRNSGISGGKIVGLTNYIDNVDVYGVWIKDCVNVSVSNVDISNMECDGIYMSPQQVIDDYNRGNNGVFITGCTIHDNSRNNITIVDADRVRIKGCNIYNTGDLQPCCGICIEPNFHDMSGDQICKDILIQDTTINTGRDKNNYKYRTFYTYNNDKGEMKGKPVCEDVYIEHCKLTGYFGNYNGKNVYVSRDTVVDGKAEGLVRKD